MKRQHYSKPLNALRAYTYWLGLCFIQINRCFCAQTAESSEIISLMKMLYTLYCDVSLNIRNQFEKEKRIRFWLINSTNMLSEIYSLNQLKFNWINSPVDRCYRSIIEIFSVIFCSLQTRFLEQRRNERNEKKEHKHHLIKCKYNLLLAMSRKSFAWSSNDDRFWWNLNTDYKWYSINFFVFYMISGCEFVPKTWTLFSRSQPDGTAK